jgi:hypothetical protein
MTLILYQSEAIEEAAHGDKPEIDKLKKDLKSVHETLSLGNYSTGSDVLQTKRLIQPLQITYYSSSGPMQYHYIWLSVPYYTIRNLVIYDLEEIFIKNEVVRLVRNVSLVLYFTTNNEVEGSAFQGVQNVGNDFMYVYPTIYKDYYNKYWIRLGRSDAFIIDCLENERYYFNLKDIRSSSSIGDFKPTTCISNGNPIGYVTGSYKGIEFPDRSIAGRQFPMQNDYELFFIVPDKNVVDTTCMNLIFMGNARILIDKPDGGTITPSLYSWTRKDLPPAAKQDPIGDETDGKFVSESGVVDLTEENIII